MDRLGQLLCDRLRAHLDGAPPMVPDFAALLWGCFGFAHGFRVYGEHGPQPIAVADCEAWARGHGLRLDVRDMQRLAAMDRVYMDHAAKMAKTGGPLPELTAAAFDAVF